MPARDLRPTLGLPTLIAATAAECFALGPGRTLQTLYPGQTAAGRLPALLTS